MTESLAKYKNSPVIETVLGVEFKPIIGWQIPHFGLYWNRIRHKYQNCSVQPPLPEQVERFSKEPATITINLPAHNDVRCWFFDENQNWLLQVQNNRFISNWKRKTPAYPAYEGFCDRFDDQWDRFRDFLSKEGLGTPEILQCEISYVNHIELERDFEGLDQIFPVWRGFPEGNMLSKPEAIAFNTVYIIPENIGRLYIAMQPVVRHADLKTVIQLAVTAKVKVASKEGYDLKRALKIAHEHVVNGFTNFTSFKMHELWERVK